MALKCPFSENIFQRDKSKQVESKGSPVEKDQKPKEAQCDYCSKGFARTYKVVTQRFCSDKACEHRWPKDERR